MTKIESLAALIRDIIATDNDGPRLIAEVLRDERRIYDELDDGALAQVEWDAHQLRDQLDALTVKHDALCRDIVRLSESICDEEE
jgi:hypothetical protein